MKEQIIIINWNKMKPSKDNLQKQKVSQEEKESTIDNLINFDSINKITLPLGVWRPPKKKLQLKEDKLLKPAVIKEEEDILIKLDILIECKEVTSPSEKSDLYRRPAWESPHPYTDR